LKALEQNKFTHTNTRYALTRNAATRGSAELLSAESVAVFP
jgi:hypothetical protein